MRVLTEIEDAWAMPAMYVNLWTVLGLPPRVN
ncbi:hypothetical protein B0G69_3663 [Paraburkholderia sp. RAU2J]|nr:hypothetical protein B0G69_3663 [Paraburkholderia sp. RAU2J]